MQLIIRGLYIEEILVMYYLLYDLHIQFNLWYLIISTINYVLYYYRKRIRDKTFCQVSYILTSEKVK